MKEIMYMNFKKSITHLIKNQFLLLIFSFIEFTIVFIHILNTSIFIISFTSNISPYDNSIETISPYHYFRKLYSNSLSYKISIASVSILILIICGFFSLIAQINSEVLNAIFVNLYDILITRTFFICIVDIYIYTSIYYSFVDKNYILCLEGIIMGILIICVVLNRINLLCIFPTKDISYPINNSIRICDYYLFLMKIFISIATNVQELPKEKFRTLTMFLHCLIVIYLIVGFILYLIYLIKEAVYAMNVLAQIKLRMFFFCFTFGVNISVLFFYRESTNVYLFGVLIFGWFIISIALAGKYRPFYIALNYIDKDHPEKQIVLIMHIITLKNSGIYFTLLNERIKNHFIFCKTCPMCKEIEKIYMSKQESTLSSYQSMFFRLLTNKSKERKESGKEYLYDYFWISEQMKKESTYNFMFHYNSKKLLKKYQTLSDYAYFNLRYIYENFSNSLSIKDNTQYKQIFTFDLIYHRLEKAIDKILFQFNVCNTATPVTIIEFSNELEIIEKDHNKPLADRDNLQNYPLVLLRMVQEELLNIPVSKIEGSLRATRNFSEDFLSFHYHEDRIMIVSVNLFFKRHLITRTGGNLLSYLNMEFQKLFPENFQEFGLELFTKILNSDSEKIFKFIVKKNIDDMNFVTFAYSFTICPGLNKDDFCIVGEYDIGNYEIIITETAQKENSEEQIFWIGKESSKIVFGNKDLLTKKEKGIFRSSLNISKIFSKSKTSTKLTLNALNAQARNLVCKLFIEFNIFDKTYRVFSVKQKSRMRQMQSGTHVHLENDSNSNTEEMEGTKALGINIGNIKMNTLWIDDTCSVNTTTTANLTTKRITGARVASQNNVGKNKNYMKYYHRFVRTKCLMMMFSIIVIGFNVFALFEELNQNSHIIDLYNIYTNLRSANRLYYTLLSSLFSVVCLGYYQRDECISYYEQHSLSEMTRLNLSINVYDYLIKENEIKLNEFIERVQTLKLNLFEINDSYSSSIFNQLFIYKILSIYDGEVHIIEKETTFSNGLEILINSIHIIVDDDEYFTRPIYFFSAYPSPNFDNVPNKTLLTQSQIEYYNCFINYNSYLLTWVHIQTSTYNIIHKKLDTYDMVSNYLMIVSFILHIFLGFVLLFYLYSFYKLITLNIEKILRRLKNPKKKEYYAKKFELLGDLCKLYKKNPLTIIKELDTMEKKYKLVNKKGKKIKNSLDEKRMSLTQNEPQTSKPKDQIYLGSIYFDLLSGFFYGLLAIFLYYVILFICFMLLWKDKITATKTIVELVQSISLAESSGFNGLTLTVLMIMSNQTEKDLSAQLEYNGDDYLSNSLLTSIQTFYNYEKKRNHLIKSIDDYFEQNCENFYHHTNDSKIYQIDQANNEVEYVEGLIDLCNKNNYFKISDDKIFTQTIYYSLLQIVKNFNISDYEGYLNVVSKDSLYNLFNMEFLLFRPLRTWINEVVFQEGIDKASNGETVILILYLVINNITEVTLIIIIYTLFIGKIKTINDRINRLISVFSIINNTS